MSNSPSFKAVKKELTLFGRNPQTDYRKKGEVLDFDVRYSIGINRIIYSFEVRGKSANYSVTIAFDDVSFSKDRDRLHQMPAKVKGKYGVGRPTNMWYRKPALNKNPTLVKSTDPDFRFRFMKELADNKGLYPASNSWLRYDARNEYKKNPNLSKPPKDKKFYKVKHPQGGSYWRATPHPDEGGKQFENPKGLMGYSYPIAAALKFLRKEELIK